MWRLVTVLVIITLLITGVAGYIIFHNFYSPAPSQQPTSKYLYLSPQTPKPTRTPDEINALLLVQNSPEEEKEKLLELVTSRSKNADYLNIGKCYPGPYAMRVRYKDKFLVKNPNPKPHTIKIDEAHIYEVPANGQLTITVDFGKESGVFPYSCDDSPTPVGFFNVSK